MKLLLTSANIRNKSQAKALEDLVGKPLVETKLAYIPTAGNVEDGDKFWMIDNLIQYRDLGLKEIDIVDISALPQEMWQPRLEHTDVLSFGGGNTFHLMHWIRKSGLQKLLPELLKTRVYVGTSAGSMVTAKNFEPPYVNDLYEENRISSDDPTGLGYVHFLILPHYKSPYFPKVNEENVDELSGKLEVKAYVLDDQSAVKVVGDKIDVVSEGNWKEIGKF